MLLNASSLNWVSRAGIYGDVAVDRRRLAYVDTVDEVEEEGEVGVEIEDTRGVEFLEEVVEEVSIGVIVVRIGVEVATVEEFVVVPDLEKDRTPILERRIAEGGEIVRETRRRRSPFRVYIIGEISTHRCIFERNFVMTLA